MTNNTNGVAQPVQKTPPIPFGEQVRSVSFAEDMFHVHFVDGRMLAVPIRWYPRLSLATPDQYTQWSLSDDGCSIVWSGLDECIRMEELLWDGPNKHESNRLLEQDARALAADEALNVEALEWIETLIGDVALDGENETEIEAKAVAWAEEILRRYQPAIS